MKALALALTIVLATLVPARIGADACGDCLRARFWTTTGGQFPETQELETSRPKDV